MSIATLKDKTVQLIDLAEKHRRTIDYPEWGFTRPWWWLERPELTEGAKEVWYLLEFEADATTYSTYDISQLEILPNGKKQMWINEQVTIDNVIAGGRYAIKMHRPAIEIIINCDNGIGAALPYRWQGEGFTNLQVITGTLLWTAVYLQDGVQSRHLTVLDCPIKKGHNTRNYMFQYANIIKAPEYVNETEGGASMYGREMYRDCPRLKDGGYLNFISVDTMFYNCPSLEKVRISAYCGGFTANTFYGCKRLIEVTVEDGFSGSLYLSNSTRYTADTLHAIIEAYADMTDQTAPTFQIGTTNIAKIDEEHIAMLTAKNITYK